MRLFHLDISLHQLIGFDGENNENDEAESENTITKLLRKTNNEDLKWELITEKELFYKKIIDSIFNMDLQNKGYFCKMNNGYFILAVFLSPSQHYENVSVKLFSLFKDYAEPHEISVNNSSDINNLLKILQLIDYDLYTHWNTKGAEIFENSIN